jgi:uncharacterized protein (DUF427 family)
MNLNFWNRPQPIPAQAGQESVWDYPRPAIWQDTDKRLQVICNGIVLAETQSAKRVLETSHPPCYYIPIADIQMEYLVPTSRRTRCEWKGVSVYYDVVMGDRHITNAAWRYLEPTPNFTAIQDCLSFYGSLMDACYVNDELITPQAGDFYGGWITNDVVGPFKGETGTWGW